MKSALSVLIVEDQDWQLQKFKKLVKSLGHQVIVAKDGAAGEQIITHYPMDVDAVICDVQMQPQDGLYFIEQISVALVNPPPVLLHSGAVKYKPTDKSEPINLIAKFRDHKFVEFCSKDDNLSYIKRFLERVAPTTTTEAK